MESVLVSVRVSPVIREMMRLLAEAEDRTLGSWVTVVVKRLAEGAKLDLSGFDPTIVKKPVKDVVDEYEEVLKLSPFDQWKPFVDMRRSSKDKKPLTVGAAKRIIKDLYAAEDCGWVIDDLLLDAIDRGWWKPVYDKHLLPKTK
jgi:hypothetical protein